MQGAACSVQRAKCRVLGTGIGSPIWVGVRRYQDLLVWQLADELKKKVYELVDHSPARKDFRFCDQIKDSASSAPANIAEGFGCYYHKQFARYVRIGRASLHETHNHLGDGVDRRHWTQQQAVPLQDLADRAVAASTGLMSYLARTEAPTRYRKR